MLDYFSHQGFQKLFSEVGNKYKSLGRVGGSIKLGGLSSEEREVLSGFCGRDYQDSTQLVIKLAEVEKILQQSRFDIDLPSFLEMYFGRKIVPNKDIAQAESKKWLDFFDRMKDYSFTELTLEWLVGLYDGKSAGYRTLLSMYRQNEREAFNLLKLCVEALDRLVKYQGRRQWLPVFAAILTGDPHALDMQNPLGRLLFYGLHHMFQLPETEYQAERRKILFSKAGLEEDDLSSNVIVAGLKVKAGDLREQLFNSAVETASPLVLPLRFLEQPTTWDFMAVYVMENPSVFSTLLDYLGGDSKIPAMVCSSGQPSVAALKLLDQLAAAGCIIYYSGDFDHKGLEIGQRLAERYSASFCPWFFNTAAYLQTYRKVKMSPEQSKKLAGLEVSWDDRLIKTMLEAGAIVYQEVLLEQMVGFFKRIV